MGLQVILIILAVFLGLLATASGLAAFLLHNRFKAVRLAPPPVMPEMPDMHLNILILLSAVFGLAQAGGSLFLLYREGLNPFFLAGVAVALVALIGAACAKERQLLGLFLMTTYWILIIFCPPAVYCVYVCCRGVTVAWFSNGPESGK